MSTHASTKIDQKEYLKKYLSGDKKKKRKKDKKNKTKPATVRIIDDDMHALDNGNEIDEELLLTGDDAPQIVGEYVLEQVRAANAPKWRNIAVKLEKQESDDEEVRVKQEAFDDLWGRKPAGAPARQSTPPTQNSFKANKRQQTPDNSPPRIISPSSIKLERDCSPQRKRDDKRSGDQSPRRSRRKSRSIDQSPPRKQQQKPARQRSRSKSSDQSPPRRRKQSTARSRRSKSADQSPPRRRKHSPARPRRKSRDQSPVRKRRQSPQRRANRSVSRDQTPQRRKSPSRRREADNASRTKQKSYSDQSPPRRRRGKEDDTDQSPPRIKKEKISPKHSPARRVNKIDKQTPSPPRRTRWEKTERLATPSPPPTHKPKQIKTLDGKRAGLQDAQSMQNENQERRRQEDLMFEQMSSSISGRDAEVQVRNTRRLGKRARDAADEDPEVQQRKAEHEQKKQDLYDRWGKGLKQIEDHRTRREAQEYESSKPLARYSDDADLEQHLREKERADDPMLEYMRKKKQERQKDSEQATMPVYSGTYPENRFGIRPGYRWDGVDRSSGYEKKWFDMQNEKRALQEEAYKYSVEDM